MQSFLHCVQEWILIYFYSNNSHNSGENDCVGKQFTIVLKTIYKKVFLQYQANGRLPSLC